MLDQDYMDTVQACSARALAENRSAIRMKKEQERRERIEDAAEAQRRSTLPVVEELKSLVEGLQEQNRILQSRNTLRQEIRQSSSVLQWVDTECTYLQNQRRQCFFHRGNLWYTSSSSQ